MRSPDASGSTVRRAAHGRDYNPPKPQRIREWQSQQEFPICPTGDPDACNVYKDLKFPDGVYENIQEYYEQKVGTQTDDR